MAIDGVLLNNCKHNLENKIIGSRVNKIYQMGKTLLTIDIRQPGESLKILISIDPEGSRVHLTDLKFEHPSHPPDFCMVLRKYLSNGNIVKITQPEFERVLHLKIDKGGKIYTLILEIMGRYSNIILIDENNIVLDAMKRVGEKKNKERQLYPGIEYQAPPPQDKLNPLNVDKKDFFEKIPDDFRKYCYKAIMYNFRGIGPNIAKEIVHRANIDYEKHFHELSNENLDSIWKSFDQIFSKVNNGEFNPTVGINEDTLIDYTSAFELKYIKDLKTKNFKTTGDLFDYFYKNHIQKREFIKLQKRLSDIVNNFLDKNRKKQRELRGKIKESKNADKYKKIGELIKSNIYQIEKGQKKVVLTDYYDSEQKEIKIELDPKITPAENAQKYFKKYEKAKKSYNHLKRELGKFRHEERYLEQVQLNIEQADSEDDLVEIENELREEGYIQKQKQGSKENKALPPRKFKSSEGYDILVGRNNKQNDYLTKKKANDHDIWVHTKKIPGSHVIIRNHANDEIPEKTIKEAAQLAAYFSKGKMSTNVPVDYTTVKNVNKPKGAKPGLVYYDDYKTLYADPDKELVKKLSENAKNTK